MLRVLWSSLPNTDSHDSEAFYMVDVLIPL
jgi:hypothetical protein